ncbi:MAG: anthranilate phosphoribosyltransferase [Thermoanaerobaculia bacterium]|nr:anthranilate phosphoribosyltransferase [Thermoanaerobaculia bacterium]
MIGDAIRRLVEGGDLTREESRELFGMLMDGQASDAQKAALLIALRMKSETVDEITGAAIAMRERVTPLDVDPEGLVDTCGTGGDGRGSFNVSTVSAIVAAGAGARVAKHGNRAVSSSCGSADVLAALGVEIELTAKQMVEVLESAGISFLFAPKLHPAMAAVSSVRRELGLRTIFNILGPLTNPAFARRQVLGVFSPRLVETMARVLAELGAEHALVVHGDDGMDEISVSGATHSFEIRDGAVEPREITPESLGLKRFDPALLHGGDAATNARIAREVLDGRDGACRAIVLANAGAAIYVSGIESTLRDGVEAARDSIDSGRALEALETLVAESRRVAHHAAGSEPA